MNVAVVGPRLLIRKALIALVMRTGSFANVLDLGNISDIRFASGAPRPEVLLIHAVDHSSGIEAIQRARELLPETRVLLLSDEGLEEESWVHALEAGAWGCLSSSDSPQHLVKALGKVAEGERWVAQRVTDLIIEKFVFTGGLHKKFSQDLTRREWEVLGLLANGYRDKEIATRLFVSKETTRSHVKSIYRKLQVKSRRGAAVYYFKHSLNQKAGSAHPESGSDTPPEQRPPIT